MSLPLPFFLVRIYFPQKLKQLPIRQSLKRRALKTYPQNFKESVVALFLVFPKVPLVHTTITLILFMTSLQANLRPKSAIFPTLFMTY